MAISFREPEVRSSLFFGVSVVLNALALVYLWHSTALTHALLAFEFVLSVAVTKKIAAGGVFHHTLGPGGKLTLRLANNRNAEVLVKDKLVLITGGNTGIGYATALNFAKWGARVVILCRDRKRGEHALQTLRAESKNNAVEFYQLDLASYQSIRKFGEEWAASGHAPIDILINNAGVMMCPFTLTADGYELQFGTNHLGHFLLTKLLLPHINTNTGRIVNLSSFGHTFAPDSTTLDYHSFTEKYKAKYNSMVTYGITKLANIYFTRQLQVELQRKKTNITTYAVHPGAVQTELARHFSPILIASFRLLLGLLFKNPNQGCQTSLYCALHPEAIPGEYYSDCSVGFQTQQTKNQAEWARLWEASEKLTAI